VDAWQLLMAVQQLQEPALQVVVALLASAAVLGVASNSEPLTGCGSRAAVLACLVWHLGPVLGCWMVPR
jgi:hypothetical protein